MHRPRDTPHRCPPGSREMTRHGPGVLRRLHSTGLEGAKTGATRIHRRVLPPTLAGRGPLPRLLHLPVFYLAVGVEGEASFGTGVDRCRPGPWPSTETGAAIVVHGLAQLLGGVHHERAHLEHRRA